jgi:hypothetical protein
MAAETATTRTLGPIGDKIVFENEFVRVWSWRSNPASGSRGISICCRISSCRDARQERDDLRRRARRETRRSREK